MLLQQRYFVPKCSMEEFGRLIRTSSDSNSPDWIAYIVALSNPVDAIELIRSEVANPGDRVEDMGRVSEELVKVLNIKPGDFKRAGDRPA